MSFRFCAIIIIIIWIACKNSIRIAWFEMDNGVLIEQKIFIFLVLVLFKDLYISPTVRAMSTSAIYTTYPFGLAHSFKFKKFLCVWNTTTLSFLLELMSDAIKMTVNTVVNNTVTFFASDITVETFFEIFKVKKRKLIRIIGSLE